jgi:hypothetical protein
MRALVAALAVLALACVKPPPPPDLHAGWPTQAGDYETTTRTWTRSGKLRRDYQLVAEAHATLKAPPWRAAWIDRRARRGNLTGDGRARLEAEQRADDAAALEFAVVLTTWDRRENDLDRGERSVWRIVLVDDRGVEIPPSEIRRDKRPDNVIRAEYPAYGDFSRVYTVTFPRELLGTRDQLTLKMSSTRGGFDLVWQHNRR